MLGKHLNLSSRGKSLRKYLLAAAAAAAIASPAAARDGSGYFGVEGGVLFPKDTHVNFSGVGTYTDYYDDVYEATGEATFKTNYKAGLDLDLIAGYDFGLFRIEGELGWKKASHKRYDDAFASLETEYDTYTSGPGDIDADGKTTVVSGMVNALLDFGSADGLSFYAGGGVGLAKTKYRLSIDDPDTDLDAFTGTAKDSGFAWQLIAGARYPISPNIDLGLKYRYFHGNKVKESLSLVNEPVLDGTVDADFDANTRFKSHSLLASVVFNFGGAVAAPTPAPMEAAPPPPPPATQTCADGTVVLATEACPVAAPPPPPPPPAPERG